MNAQELKALVKLSEASWFYLSKPVYLDKADIITLGFNKTLFELEDMEPITVPLFKTYIDFILKGIEVEFTGLKGSVIPVRVKQSTTAKEIMTLAVSGKLSLEEKVKIVSNLASKAGFKEEITIRKVMNKTKKDLNKILEALEVIENR